MTMRISIDQLLADRRRMKAYIALRIPEEGCRIVLALGPEGEVWVESLHWQTNCKEAVGIPEVYEYLRREAMTVEEWRRELALASSMKAQVVQVGETRPPSPMVFDERLYTVREAAQGYFQGKVSPREINALFHNGSIRGFRVGSKILLYQSSLDEYRQAHENKKPSPEQPEALGPILAPTPLPGTKRQNRRGANSLPPIRLKRLPDL
jgi:hypothetical protein